MANERFNCLTATIEYFSEENKKKIIERAIMMRRYQILIYVSASHELDIIVVDIET